MSETDDFPDISFSQIEGEAASSQTFEELGNRVASPTLLESYDSTYVKWRSTKAKNVLSSSDIVNTNCCVYCCNLFVSRSSILKDRMLLADVGGQVRSAACFWQAVQVYMRPFTSESGQLKPFIGGVRVCVQMMALVVGVTMTRLLNLIQSSAKGGYVHGREGATYTSEKTLDAVGSGLYQLNSLGQDDPCDGGILMPAGYSRTDFAKDCRPDESFKFSTFKKISKRKPKFRKTDSHLRCSTCSLIARGLLMNRGNPSKRREIIWARKQHFEDIRRERLLIKEAEVISRAEPSRLLVLKHDSMSKDATKLPSFVSRAKTVTDASRIAACLHAVQSARSGQDGRKYMNYVFLNPGSCTEGGSDYFSSTILYTLAQIDVIPEVLLFHQDNVISNKSDGFLSFCAWLLLQLEAVKEIRVVYSVVGHTHNSVDALFGTLRKSLITSDISTVEDLEDFLGESRNVFKATTCPAIFSFSPLCGLTKGYKFRSCQHQFYFRRDDTGGVLFSYSRFLASDSFSEGASLNLEEYPVFENKDDLEEARHFIPEVLPMRNVNLRIAVTTLLKAAAAFLRPDQIAAWKNLPAELETKYANAESCADLLSSIRSKSPTVSASDHVTGRATLNQLISDSKLKSSRPWNAVQPLAKKRRT